MHTDHGWSPCTFLEGPNLLDLVRSVDGPRLAYCCGYIDVGNISRKV